MEFTAELPMNTNASADPPNQPSTSERSAQINGQRVARISRKLFGWLLLGIVLAPLIGKLVMTKNAARTPNAEVFPLPPRTPGAESHLGVVGAWSSGTAPASMDDVASIDPNRPIIVRTYDLDGWVLRYLAKGRLDPMLEKEYAEPLKNWAIKLLNPKIAEINTGNVANEILQEKFSRLFLEVRMRLNLMINDQVIVGLNALNASESKSLKEAAPKYPDRWDDFVFNLRQDDSTQSKLFRDLARGSGLTENVRLTLSFPVDKDQKETMILPTLLEPNAPVPSQQLEVSFAPGWKLWFMFLYGMAILAGMTVLGLQTNMLRGLESRRRPDGRHQLSLSHVQLAIWFVVVFGSYIYLWVITGDLNTLSTSGLYLVSIAIVTTFGSTAIQGMSGVDKELAAYNSFLAPRLQMDRATVIRVVDAAELKTRKRWEELQGNLVTVPERESREAFRDWDDLRRQKEYLATPLIYRWLVDILSENGEVTLHRFQMLAWTVGLAFIFCVRVFSDLTMPIFPGEVLALMGISAGTYLGFRLPEAGKIKDSLASPESLGGGGKPEPRPPTSESAGTDPIRSLQISSHELYQTSQKLP